MLKLLKSVLIDFCFIADAQQSQLDDKDRTIRIQQNLITKLEAEVDQVSNGNQNRQQSEQMVDTSNTATQTDRVCSFLYTYLIISKCQIIMFGFHSFQSIGATIIYEF